MFHYLFNNCTVPHTKNYKCFMFLFSCSVFWMVISLFQFRLSINKIEPNLRKLKKFWFKSLVSEICYCYVLYYNDLPSKVLRKYVYFFITKTFRAPYAKDSFFTHLKAVGFKLLPMTISFTHYK
jgi:hypothetical protein